VINKGIFAKNFPVVCVGGSAGGLDAYTRLLQHLPTDMGVAIVIVNHVRTVPTLLHEILPHYTNMPVELITERLHLQPNHVFIIPSKHDLHVLDGEFRLKPISKRRGWPDVITVFLRSLTKHWDGKLIAVIVSGLDRDGSAGLRDIKEVGGITIAQKLDTAAHPGMPESAIASGCIDFVLSPENIASDYGHSRRRASCIERKGAKRKRQGWLKKSKCKWAPQGRSGRCCPKVDLGVSRLRAAPRHLEL
jgi:two-component system, chemotaxis family, protein-glutamate methylesterase/glutaminase